ncbi:MAG: ABC transporter ATP-binding protein [Verrucomicrobiota bacterium]
MPNEPIKKLSHKDVSSLSTAEFLDTAKVPFIRLLSYVKPYKQRFVLGIFFGVLFGLFNAVMLFGLKIVFEIVLPKEGESVEIVISESVENQNIVVDLENGSIPQALPIQGAQAGDTATITLPVSETKTVKTPIGDINIPRPSLDKGGSIKVVVFACLIIPLLILIRGLLSYLNQYCMMWVGMRVLYDLRDKTFTSLMQQSLTFHGKQKTGELIQTVFNQTRMAQQAGTQLSSDLVKHPISIVAIVVALVYIDWLFAVCALVLFPLCLLPVIMVSKKVRQAGGKEEQEAGMIMVTMQESFAGIRVVKAHAREEFERKKFNIASTKMIGFIMRWRKAIEIVGPLVETVASLGIAVGLLYAWATQMSAGEFLIRYIALVALYPHAKALSRVQIQLQKCLVASTKVFAIMDSVPDVQDSPDAVPLARCEGAIAFENISFSYVVDKPAVADINLTMEPGKFYALVGRSGSGKSTLFSLLLRFYDPDYGTIRIDNQDIRTITQQSLRDNIGLVTQDTFLFHDSIFANIQYGKLDATKEEIEAAAIQAHAHDFIMEQKDGYNTIVGDKGCNLSGGQQQRISIARAFLRNAPILLLDEFSSALDTESEKRIQAAIARLAEGKTVIAIAHRLSTILEADQIILLEEGSIVDTGTHEEMLAHSDAYRRVYDLQFNVAPDDPIPAAIAQSHD